MAKSDEFKRADYPEIPDAEELWYDDWYDGPLCGVAMVGDQPCYYIFVEEEEWDDDRNPSGIGYYCYRVYELRKLSPEEFAREKAKHDEWELIKDDESQWDAFEEKYPPMEKLPYQDNEIIGWSAFLLNNATLESLKP